MCYDIVERLKSLGLKELLIFLFHLLDIFFVNIIWARWGSERRLQTSMKERFPIVVSEPDMVLKFSSTVEAKSLLCFSFYAFVYKIWSFVTPIFWGLSFFKRNLLVYNILLISFPIVSLPWSLFQHQLVSNNPNCKVICCCTMIFSH